MVYNQSKLIAVSDFADAVVTQKFIDILVD